MNVLKLTKVALVASSLLTVGLGTAMAAPASIPGGDSVTVNPHLDAAVVYQLPTLPDPSSSQEVIALANTPQKFVGQTITVPWNSMNATAGSVDTYTSDDSAPMYVVSTGADTADLVGSKPSNTSTIGFGILYTGCGNAAPVNLANCGTAGCQLQNTSYESCAGTGGTHATVAYTLTPPANKILPPDSYSINPAFGMTFQMGI